MKSATRILLCALLLSAGPLPAAVDSDDDVYKEDAIRSYVDKQDEEAKIAEELPLVIPPYPSPENLVEVDIARYGYPYRLFVDAGSVTVGNDRVVRYTAVLRSPSGVDNVSYEGVRCSGSQYKRYAYGSGGEFYPATRPQWKRIHQTRQDLHRKVLVDEYFCPLPDGDQAGQIVARLRRSGSAADSFSSGEQ